VNGPAHYAEAEKLMARAHDMEDQKGINYERRVDFIMRRAGVHATLALAAATIDAAGYSREVRKETEWDEVSS
jgi:hypothetical protein